MTELAKLFHTFQDFLDIVSRLSGSDLALIVIAAAVALLVLALRVRAVSMRRGRVSVRVEFGDGPSPPANGASLGARQRT
jgi:hypothetical protein